MLLTVDIGNTNITFGIFDKDFYVKEFRLASDKDMSQKEYEIILKGMLKDFAINSCIAASVVDELDSKIKSALDNVLGLNSIFISYNMDLGIGLDAQKPSEVGADRLANAAAVAQFKGIPVIVLDFGTATTFDILNSEGEFFGGIIAPGVKTQLKSLKLSTSKLPEITPEDSPAAIARNTKDAILSGVVRGCACMVDGLLNQCEQELGQKAMIVATGGYCKLISKYTKRNFDVVDPILTLKGLKTIYSYLEERNFAK